MSLLNEAAPGDKQLERYVLGLLPEDAAERLDELSIVDDDVASRLQVVEDALVDAYVRGELTGETLEQFEAVYLASERRREKVRFARTLLGSPVRRAVVRRSNAVWMLAAAAAVILLAGGALVYRDAQLRTELRDAQQASTELSDRARALEQQLNDARSPRVEAVKTPDAAPPALPLTALVLLPQMRATGPIPTLAIPQGIDRVALDLRVDPNDFSRYQVALRDPAADQIVWRSERIPSRTVDSVPTVSIVIPAAVLKTQHYSLELEGITSAGGSEVAGSYVLQVVRR